MERTKNSNKNIKLQIKSFLKKISLQSWCACKRTSYVTSNDTLGLMLGWPTMLCPSKICVRLHADLGIVFLVP